MLRIAKQRDKNSKDIYQTKLIKDEKGTVLIEDDKIVDRWRGYFQKLMNEENPRERRQEQQEAVNTEVAEITPEEVERALGKMKMEKLQDPLTYQQRCRSAWVQLD